MNYLISPEAGCGHACELAKAIGYKAYYFTRSEYELDFIYPGTIGYSLPQQGNHLVIMTAYAYDEIVQRYGVLYFHNFDKVTIIVPDGRVWHNPEKYQRAFEGFRQFATPCKIQYLPKAREYIQPFDLSWVDIKKNERLTISHSPYSQDKMHEKGTLDIYKFLLGYNFKIITGKSWRECILEKAKSHVFIDQIVTYCNYTGKTGNGVEFPKDWRGGVGKSGYEAMLLKNCVISTGKYKGIEIPEPPVVWIDNYQETIKRVINDKAYMDKMAKLQYKWALKYCNPEFQAKRIC